MESINSMDWESFKKVSDLGFARRHRQFRAGPHAAYVLDKDTLKIDEWKGSPAVTADVISGGSRHIPLRVVVIAIENGIFRVVMDDLEAPLQERHLVEGVVMDHVKALSLGEAELLIRECDAQLVLPGRDVRVRFAFDPFRIDLVSGSDESVLVSMNGESRLKVEAFESKQSAASTGSGQGDDGAPEGRWEETFRGFTDPKVRGPESVGLDIAFPNADHVYGIPERTSSFSLQDTLLHGGEVLSEPYRLYNLDVSYYEIDKPLGLYGAIPFLVGREGKNASAVLWLNSSETYVDLTTDESGKGKRSHWFSESGFLDVYLLPGKTADAVFQQYLWLTGAPAMPQKFALGYHQCRYSYMSDGDVRGVNAGFEDRNIPYDAIWLDIDHTDGKRYFTWDKDKFPDPTALQNHIASFGRKTVAIVDPHIKREPSYALHQVATEKGLYVADPSTGKAFIGECWAGSSSYYDYTTAAARSAWASRFSADNYAHFTSNLHIWNDMNEPSVFDGPEYTIPKHMVHANNVEHRHVHNVYGHNMVRATYAGLREGRNNSSRPFLLTRSFFAGSQRYASVWTGDNTASWSHMASSVRMVLSLQMCGIAHSGADVGGFFGDPDGDLVTRWYQVGAFQPFFRGHSMTNTKRREPWVFGEPYTSHIRAAIVERYQLLPYWYTLFAAVARGTAAGFSGRKVGPPMRPVWWEFSDAAEDEARWMVGDALLVAPVLQKDTTQHHRVELPAGALWYDLHDEAQPGVLVKGEQLRAAGGLERMFVLQRGGTIVPRQCTPRRCASAMSDDAYTLVVALDERRQARGELYLDDGSSYAHEGGKFELRELVYENGVLKARTVGGSGGGFVGCEAVVGCVVVLGFGALAPKAVLADGREVGCRVDKGGVLRVEDVRLPVTGEGWELVMC